MSAPDIAVVGGGIVGLACARAFAARGRRVTVLERHRPGMEASFAAAGMLAPLAEVPEAGPFFDACRTSRDLWQAYAPALADETGTGLDHDTSGSVLIDDHPTLERFEAAARQLGEPVEHLDGANLRALLPDLAPDIDRTLLLPGEHRIDSRAVCRALETSLATRGVRVESGRTVTAVRGSGHRAVLEGDGWRLEAGAVLIAAGAWSGTIAGLPPLAIRPVHGDILAFAGVDWPFSGCVRTAEAYAVRRAGNGLVIGATVADRGFSAQTSDSGQAWLRNAAGRLFPRLAGRAPIASWSGLRPGTPDDLPFLGRLDDGPVWIATGHYRNGILLAPWTAEMMADAVAGSTAALRTLAPFAPARYAAGALSGRA